jgi:hypothetical protein
MLRVLPTLVLVSSVCGCVYTPARLADGGRCPVDAEGRRGPCGLGEACSVRGDEVICTCGVDVHAEGRACRDAEHPEEPLQCTQFEGQSVCNRPPVAVIGDGSPSLLRPVAVTVVIPGSAQGLEQYDIGGQTEWEGVQTYRWEILDAGCSANPVPVPTDEPDLVVETAGPGSVCVVTLSVQDSRGAWSAPTPAEIRITDSGTFVRGVGDCFSGLVTSETLKDNGLPTRPWCTISQGLEASRILAAPEVRVAAGEYAETIRVEGFPVTLVGGLDPNNDWDPSQPAQPSVIRSSATSGPAVRVSWGGESTVRNFEIYRDAQCTGDCTLFFTEHTRLTIDNCVLGGTQTGTNPDTFANETSAPSSASRTLYVYGSCGGVSLMRSTVLMSKDARQSYGIVLDYSQTSGFSQLFETSVLGSLTGTLDLAIGIQLMGTAGMSLGPNPAELTVPTKPNVVDIECTSCTANHGIFGIVDGSHEPVTALACLNHDGNDCTPSQNLTITDTRLRIANREGRANAVAFYGTESPAILMGRLGTTLSIGDGLEAIGVHTVATSGASIAGASDAAPLIISVTSGDNTFQRLATGILDGIFASGPEGLPNVTPFSGSTGVVIQHADITMVPANGSPDEPNAHAAVILAGTQGAGHLQWSMQHNRIHVARRTPATGTSPKVLAGVWTLATSGMAMVDTTIDRAIGEPSSMKPPDGEPMAAGFLDGWPWPAVLQSVASTELTLSHNKIAVDFASNSVASGPLACVLLAGTSSASVVNNTMDCSASTAAASLERPLHQIWLLATVDATLEANTFGGGTLGGPSLRNVAIRDGRGTTVPSDVAASVRLAIQANKVYAALGTGGGAFRSRDGIWIDHDPEVKTEVIGRVRIVNNAVFTAAAAGLPSMETSVALRLVYAWADVRSNTLHGGVQPVSGHYYETAGLVLTDELGSPRSLLVNNLIVASDSSVATSAVAVHDLTATFGGGGTTVDVPSADFEGNILLAKTGAAFYKGGGGAVIDTAGGLQSSTSLSKLTAATDDPLCAGDLHIKPNPMVFPYRWSVFDAADTSDNPTVDIDGASRQPQGTEIKFDVGADELSDNSDCPG